MVLINQGVPQLVKEILVFYENRRIIASFKATRHISLSWDELSTPCHPMSPISSSKCPPPAPFPSGHHTKIL